MIDKIQANDIGTIEPKTVHVGEGANVKGDILAPHLLVVDGCIEGSVTGRAIRVGPSGEIKGKIVVEEAEIYGKISEKIEIKQLLFVHTSGQVSGEISYGELELEKGAILCGTLSRNDLQPDKEEPKLEQILSKSERPAVLRRIEPDSQNKANGAEVYTKVPAMDLREAS